MLDALSGDSDKSCIFARNISMREIFKEPIASNVLSFIDSFMKVRFFKSGNALNSVKNLCVNLDSVKISSFCNFLNINKLVARSSVKTGCV